MRYSAVLKPHKALLPVDVRAVIQCVLSRLYFVKAKPRERPERCATRGEEVGGEHRSGASLPAITSEMKCWFSFVLIFSKCARSQCSRGVMCVKQDAPLEAFLLWKKRVFKKGTDHWE